MQTETTDVFPESIGRRAFRHACLAGAVFFAVVAALKWVVLGAQEGWVQGRDPAAFLLGACLFMMGALYVRRPSVHVHVHHSASSGIDQSLTAGGAGSGTDSR